uniref:Uncharacterized protein n=1 Tax=Megaselia scalaris TaxID=36166 RepID=T1GRL5_MEGSC
MTPCDVGLQAIDEELLSSRKETSHRKLGQSVTIRSHQFQAVHKTSFTWVPRETVLGCKANSSFSQPELNL